MHLNQRVQDHAKAKLIDVISQMSSFAFDHGQRKVGQKLQEALDILYNEE